MLIREQELKQVRDMTIGKLLDTLAQDDYDNYDWDKMRELKCALCPILIQARDFFAGQNDVCRGAFAIAATAIEDGSGGTLYNYTAEQMTEGLVLLVNEMLSARGPGYWSVETLVNLRKIRDLFSEDYVDEASWPDQTVTVYPPQPVAVAA
jgi:hypothetical protein